MNLLEIATKASIKAGIEVLRQYHSGFEVEIKPDNSPVTSADIAAHNILERELSVTNIPILSEEGNKNLYHNGEKHKSYWILDPIDGTRDFVNKTDEYCICVGLISNNNATLGVLCAPSLNLFYFGSEDYASRKFLGSFEDLTRLIKEENFFEELLKNSEKLPTQELPKDFTFLSSRFHLDNKTKEYIEVLKKQHANIEYKKIGCAIKLGLIADKTATEYTRFHKVNFWDIAAGHAIAKYAGLKVCVPNTNKEIDYSQDDMKVNGFSVKW